MPALFLVEAVASPARAGTLVGAMGMILGNAAGTSWELLVEIAKHRRTALRG
jgi:hypothetical protein